MAIGAPSPRGCASLRCLSGRLPLQSGPVRTTIIRLNFGRVNSAFEGRDGGIRPGSRAPCTSRATRVRRLGRSACSGRDVPRASGLPASSPAPRTPARRAVAQPQPRSRASHASPPPILRRRRTGAHLLAPGEMYSSASPLRSRPQAFVLSGHAEHRPRAFRDLRRRIGPLAGHAAPRFRIDPPATGVFNETALAYLCLAKAATDAKSRPQAVQRLPPWEIMRRPRAARACC